MEQILNHLNQAIADEALLKSHYLAIADNQLKAGNFTSWSSNTAYAVFAQHVIDRLQEVLSAVPEPKVVEEQIWC